jgi:hypothetical protein
VFKINKKLCHDFCGQRPLKGSHIEFSQMVKITFLQHITNTRGYGYLIYIVKRNMNHIIWYTEGDGHFIFEPSTKMNWDGITEGRKKYTYRWYPPKNEQDPT